MPRLINHVPKYCKHRATGQAYATIDGRCFYFGKHGSAASRAEYDRRIAEWIAAGRRTPIDPQAITIAEVVAAYRKHARRYYTDADGQVSGAVINTDQALKPVVKLFARTPAAEFSPLRLKAVQQHMIEAGVVRTNINRHVQRIRSVFKWATENELIPASVFHALMAVSGLRAGRGGAIESQPIKPVPIEYVDAVLAHVAPQVAAMIKLQLLTGMRPGEVTTMRGCELDTTGSLWVYRPAKHKTAHHGHKREIFIGPRGQMLLQPFLKTELQAFMFSPAEAEAWRRARLRAARKTPLSCGNRAGTNRRRRPVHQPGQVYTVSAYYVAIRRGCDVADRWAKAGMVIGDEERAVPRWHPHQLRHTAATELRKTYGLEAAQVILGHATLDASQIYAEKNADAARKIMAAVG